MPSKLIGYLLLLSTVLISMTCHIFQEPEWLTPQYQRNISFNHDWRFYKCDSLESSIEDYKNTDFDDSHWEPVLLPHTAHIEPLVVEDQWQDICWYRKHFRIDPEFKGKIVRIRFEGAMHTAAIWVNGKYLTTHYGGYLPFSIDLTDIVQFDKPNVIAVRLDNRNDAQVPPGKPLERLDFCWFSGLYRNVHLDILNPLHITDPVHAQKKAGGGVFVTFPKVAEEEAEVQVQVHLQNSSQDTARFKLLQNIAHSIHITGVLERSALISLPPGCDTHYIQTFNIKNPFLWHPHHPEMYKLITTVISDEKRVDRITTNFGIRHIDFNIENGFQINGESFYMQGTNRHQEYPYIGYALSDNAQYRDALKIKEAGFDFVRASHYPHAEAFMSACDELGLLVMDAIPGWQFFGDSLFQERSLQDCRDLVRRDRNHPSVVLWEVSLNESGMSQEFMRKAHRIAHEEYPGDQCFTCGWLDDVYDVFIPARQHSRPPDYWAKYQQQRPIFIAEYGDWEYYAQNAGFNQDDFEDLSADERTSRQLRGHGEIRLLQQALNYQEALNSNLQSKTTGCANWLMFDYNRGYADDIEASGIQDIFRIPKFANYFYQSQQSPDISNPMVYIASYWTEQSDLDVRVFSNCEQVELILNRKSLGIQISDNNPFSDCLKHPPFTFKLESFQEGSLEAVGFIDGKAVATQKVKTPQQSESIQLEIGMNGIQPAAGEKDVFFVYASIVDKNGTVVPSVKNLVTFSINGPGNLIGQNPIQAEAGIAPIILQTNGDKGVVEISANIEEFKVLDTIKIKIK